MGKYREREFFKKREAPARVVGRELVRLQGRVLGHQMAEGDDAVLRQDILGGLVVLHAEDHTGLAVGGVMKA